MGQRRQRANKEESTARFHVFVPPPPQMKIVLWLAANIIM
jgi:hypothetical protein